VVDRREGRVGRVRRLRIYQKACFTRHTFLIVMSFLPILSCILCSPGDDMGSITGGSLRYYRIVY
jgi:hypothetical protein